MAERIGQMQRLVTNLEGEQSMAARASTRWNSAKTCGSRSCGMWMIAPPRRRRTPG
jgi:hypothetical protein